MNHIHLNKLFKLFYFTNSLYSTGDKVVSFKFVSNAYKRRKAKILRPHKTLLSPFSGLASESYWEGESHVIELRWFYHPVAHHIR